MSIESQRNSYFERLKDYQIDHTEWEDIIWKLNQKESGLSEYFVKGTGNNAKTMSVRELVEEHFLDAADKKLNNETNQIGNFSESLQKYAESYRQNQSSIQQEKEIRKFQSMEPELSAEIKNCKDAKERLDDGEKQVIAFLRGLHEAGNQAERRIKELDEAKRETDRKIKQTKYEKASMEYYDTADEIGAAIQRKAEAEKREKDLKTELSELEDQIHIQSLAEQSESTNSFRKEMLEEKEKFDAAKKNKKELTDEQDAIGYALKIGYGKLKGRQEKEIEACNSSMEELDRQVRDTKTLLDEYQKELRSLTEKKGK